MRICLPCTSSSFFLALAIVNMLPTAGRSAESWELQSPQGRLSVLIESGERLTYAVRLRGETIVQPSPIDLNVEGVGWLARNGGAPAATEKAASETVDFPVPRKYRRLKLDYRELTLTFGNGHALRFRAYDEGVAYRWQTSAEGEITIVDELAEFAFPADARAWFPEEESMFSHQERQYKYLPLAELTAERFCSTGVLVELAGGRKVYISESDLRSYPGMFLRGAGGGRSGLVGKYAPYPLEAELKNDRDMPVVKAAPYLARTAGTRAFPWRVMIATEEDAELLTSELVYALAPPAAIEDVSWIKPGKVAWEWWSGIDLVGVDFKAGVNTETYKHYVDFAADYGLQYVLLDEGWSADTRDVMGVREGLDLEELVQYARQRNVDVLLWVLWNSLDAKLDEALDWYQRLGVAGIKVDIMQRDDQWMVEFYERVARAAAKRRLLVDFHGACKPTGLRRQYPNVMTQEGVTGMEQYKWTDKMLNPEQELVLPFVRMVAGPMDVTPGALSNSNQRDWKAIGEHPMSLGTRCHQLAMYVIYESPLQMLADSPSNYRREPECMKFLSAVPTVWDDTSVLQAKVGDYVAMARRSGEAWFIGAMTDWQRRSLTLDLGFLPAGEFVLESWSDGVNAERNGRDFAVSEQQVAAGDRIEIDLAPGGGWVGWVRPATAVAEGGAR